MSLKVYEAYRIKEGHDHWDVLMKIKKRGREEARAKLAKLTKSIQDGLNNKDPGRLEQWTRVLSNRPLKEEYSFLDADDYVKAQYRAQQNDPYFNMFDFDVSIAVRRFEKNWLLIPYGGSRGFMKGCLGFLDEMEGLEDYHYQDQSDPPDPEPENWDERSRVWNELCEENNWQYFVTVDIVSLESWFDVSPAWQQASKDTEATIAAMEDV